jgi:hypothetical protein
MSYFNQCFFGEIFEKYDFDLLLKGFFIIKKMAQIRQIMKKGAKGKYSIFLPITIRVFTIFAHWIKVRPPLTFGRHPSIQVVPG